MTARDARTPTATSPDDDSDPPPEAMVLATTAHPRAIRWMHWINFPILAIMIWSGLRIYWANDVYAAGVGDTEVFAFFPDGFYEALGLQRQLARGIAFHFTFGWFFVLNGIAYLSYLAVSGQWRHIIPDRFDLRDSFDVVLHDLRIRKSEPVKGRYNAAQKIAYSAVIVMGILIVASGFSIYKPTQLSLLTSLFGGYDTARLIHFWTTIGLSSFFVIHVLQVIRAGAANFMSMVTGFDYSPSAVRQTAEEDPATSDGDREVSQ